MCVAVVQALEEQMRGPFMRALAELKTTKGKTSGTFLNRAEVCYPPLPPVDMCFN